MNNKIDGLTKMLYGLLDKNQGVEDEIARIQAVK